VREPSTAPVTTFKIAGGRWREYSTRYRLSPQSRSVKLASTRLVSGKSGGIVSKRGKPLGIFFVKGTARLSATRCRTNPMASVSSRVSWLVNMPLGSSPINATRATASTPRAITTSTSENPCPPGRLWALDFNMGGHGGNEKIRFISFIGEQGSKTQCNPIPHFVILHRHFTRW